MKAEFKTITPEMAKSMLELNRANRNISKNSVNKYARDMIAGKWQENGEPIQIGTNGTLKNGQHRLSAIVQANVPVRMLVVSDIPDTVSVYDTGRKRSNTDLAKFDNMDSGRANNSYIGACTFTITAIKGDRTVSYAEVKSFIENYGDDMDIAYSICNKKNKKGEAKIRVAPFMSATFFAIQHGYPMDKLEMFWNIVKTGFYNSPAEKAAVILRNQIVTDDINFASKHERKRALYACEQALRDFEKGIERQKTYYNTSPVYSNNWKGDLDE